MKNINRKSGFSLIELLVASSIMITATTVVLAIIVSSFRGSSKITSNQIVRQNGNNAVAQFSRMIQFAESFEGASQIDEPEKYDAVCPASGKEYYYIKIEYPAGQPKTLACTNAGLLINGDSIIDNRVYVANDSCKFTCAQESEATSPIIGINFDLLYGDPALNPVEKTAKINFSTRVKMRNNN